MTGDKLTQDQVNAAIVTLAGYTGQPFTDEQRAAWRNVLVTTYRSGELAEALDKWQRGPKGRIRPDPSDLSCFLPGPERVLPPNDWSLPHPDGPAPETNREMNLRMLDEVRAANKIRSKYKEAAK